VETNEKTREGEYTVKTLSRKWNKNVKAYASSEQNELKK
jgi:hypothetical protein